MCIGDGDGGRTLHALDAEVELIANRVRICLDAGSGSGILLDSSGSGARGGLRTGDHDVDASGSNQVARCGDVALSAVERTDTPVNIVGVVDGLVDGAGGAAHPFLHDELQCVGAGLAEGVLDLVGHVHECLVVEVVERRDVGIGGGPVGECVLGSLAGG